MERSEIVAWKIALAVFFLICSASGILLASASGPVLAVTGDFGEGNCTGCHGDFALNTAGGSLEIQNVPPSYTPGQTYPITVLLRRTGQSRWGFMLSTRTAGGAQAGTLAAGAGMQVRSQGGIQYISHTLAGTQNGSAQGTWTFNWTAPNPAVGAIRFSAAGNAANGNQTTSGDFIYTTTATSQAAAAPTISALFAHIAVGGGYSTGFTLTNTGSDSASGNLILTQSNGTALDATIASPLPGSQQPAAADRIFASTFPINVPAGGTQFIKASSAAGLQSGWARVESNGGQLSGVATFQLLEGNLLKTIAGVLGTGLVQSATIPVDDDLAADRYTGFAVANPGAEDVTIRVVSVDSGGAQGPTLASITLNPGKHQAGFVFQYPTAGRKGSVVLIGQDGKRFAVVALVQNKGLFTAIPVIGSKTPFVNEPIRIP